MAATKPPASLDELLVGERLVSESALRQAHRVALRRRAALVEVLVDEHTVDEERLADAFARALSIARVPLGTLPVDEEAVREVPHDLAAAHLCVPVHLDSSGERRSIQLAMANPLDAPAREDVAHASGCHIEPVVATLTEIRVAIERAYRGLITRMIPRLAGGDEVRPSDHHPLGEPTTKPHLQLPDERSVDVRLRALHELLVERGVLGASDLEDRVRRLLRGDDV